MIRRGFWLVAGAALGVAGYRRATRLARSLSGGVSSAPPLAARARPAQIVCRAGAPGPADPATAPPAAKPGGVARIGAAVSFARDVRAGVAEYSDLHRRGLARNLGSRSDRISSG